MVLGSLQLAVQFVGKRRCSPVGSGAVLSIQYECGTVISNSAAGASTLLYGSVEGGMCSSPTHVRRREDKEGQLVLYLSATQDNMAHTGPDNLNEERGNMAFLQSTWTALLSLCMLPRCH
jgi:hypothetical protein